MKNGKIYPINFDKHDGTDWYNGNATFATDMENENIFRGNKILYKGKTYWTRIIRGLNTPFNPNETLNIEDFIKKNGKMEYNVKEDYELDESEIKEVWKSEIEEEIKGKLIKF